MGKFTFSDVNNPEKNKLDEGFGDINDPSVGGELSKYMTNRKNQRRR